MADRQRGVQIHRGIIYGSHARLLSEAEKQLAPPGHTHKWSIFLTSATSPPPKAGEAEDMDYIPGGADDLTYMLKKVTFRLHETYPNPSRALDKPPYIVTETGWGEFTVGIRIQFVPEANEKPITLQHPIKLHHWGAPIDPPVPAIGGGPTSSAPASAAPTPAASAAPDSAPVTEVKKDGDGDVKMEVGTPGGTSVQPIDSAAAATGAADVAGGSEAEGDVITAVRPNAADSQTAPSTPAPVSIAAKIPVHAWQYDELIFYDPPLIFYNILNEHPPTPLPARNRRPRDQREAHTQKKKKGRVSAVASSSRANTPARTESGSVPPATAVPGAGESVGVGIPGEPGSADVPLEFTAEMEKGEWNRLHDARKKIIDEMDRWRMKLIEEEKELQKLKEEMAAMAAAPAVG